MKSMATKSLERSYFSKSKLSYLVKHVPSSESSFLLVNCRILYSYPVLDDQANKMIDFVSPTLIMKNFRT